MYLKKKFKRFAENEKTAKIKWRRIMSVFLAAAMFVSGGAFSDLAKIGLTAVAEETADQDFELDSSTDTTENDDTDAESMDYVMDYGGVQLYEASPAGEDNIKIKPVFLSPHPVPYDEWQGNIYSESNPYVLKSGSTFTLCGTMTDAFIHDSDATNCTDPDHIHITTTYCKVTIDPDNNVEEYFDPYAHDTDKCTDSNHQKITKNYCISKTGSMWFNNLSNNSLILTNKEIKNAVVLSSNGDYTNEVRVYMTFEAPKVDQNNVINGIITFNSGGQDEWQHYQKFYISVRPSFIKVYTEAAERDMDKVNEFVESIWLGYDQTKQVHDDYIWNSHDTPYRLFKGETVSIRHVSGINLGDVDGVTRGTTTIDGIQYTTYTPNDLGDYSLTYDTGLKDKNNNIIYEKFYFSVVENADLDHADIEISDQNTYTVENKVREIVNGKEVERTYKIKYDVYVSDIEYSVIYDKNKKTLELKDLYYDDYIAGKNPEVTSSKVGYVPRKTDGVIPHDDYWKDPTKKPGDPQFELTSKYELDENHDLIWPSTRDNLQFKMTDVGTVDFHVELYLEPKSVTVIDENNQVCEGSAYNLADLPSVTIPKVVFEMDHQSVLDAYNKCPDHSGLDFTFNGSISDYIKINPTAVAFEAKKVFERNPDPDGKVPQFEFNLSYVSREYTVNGETITEKPNDSILLGTVKNNTDGTISFDSRNFTEEGTYTYRIEEVVDENDNTIAYDRGYIEVKVVVTRNQTANETLEGLNKIQEVTFTVEATNITYKKYISDNNSADVEGDLNKTFTNTYKVYNLPSTGGPGVYIFIISGAGFILAAAVMLYRKKRKEE